MRNVSAILPGRRLLAAWLIWLPGLPVSGFAQPEIIHIEPPFWWTGMSDPRLELMLHGPSIGTFTPVIEDDRVRQAEALRTDNPNYLFIAMELAPDAAPGMIPVALQGPQQQIELTYELRQRDVDARAGSGFGPGDSIYLLTPDRFANGNPANDSIAGMRETAVDRQAPFGRHGGDLAGVIAALPYIADMGFTRLWMNPVLENDQPEQSYHGYAATDLYRIDPRLGTREDLRELADVAEQHGIGLIWDIIPNHIGSGHWWMTDLPAEDWINSMEGPVFTNHRREAVRDPHAVAEDLEALESGWFVEAMPDLNQRHPRLARYLIQHAIWWIEFAGLAGLRVDTYPYADSDFMTHWVAALLQEYPGLGLVGEEWSLNPGVIAHWQHLGAPSMMDFPLNAAVVGALGEEENWNSGLIRVYQVLADDAVYADPGALVIFPDNHDMNRIHTALGEDMAATRMAVAMMATLRGAPQFLYGTEILMSHPGADSHGLIRSDFPGGWPGDATDGFSGRGLAEPRLEFQQWMRELLQWRKTSRAIAAGDFRHRAPVNGVYAWRRKADDECLLVLVNNNRTQSIVDLDWLSPLLDGVQPQAFVEIPAGSRHSADSPLTLPAKSVRILQVDFAPGQ